MPKPIVLKFGGSILSPGPQTLFNYAYALKLHELLAEWLNPERGPVMICVGGGFLARHFMQEARNHGEKDVIDEHKIGVAATNLNAELLHAVLSDLLTQEVWRYELYEKFLVGSTRPELLPGKVYVVGGGAPGQSNDWNALQVALALGHPQVIDVKNVAGVFTADPHKVADAKLIPKLSWDEYLELIGNPPEHVPGANYPVDVETARRARTERASFTIIGSDLYNLRSLLTQGEFVGSVIS